MATRAGGAGSGLGPPAVSGRSVSPSRALGVGGSRLQQASYGKRLLQGACWCQCIVHPWAPMGSYAQWLRCSLSEWRRSQGDRK